MRRIIVGAVMVVSYAATFVAAQQGTADLRGRVVDAQQAAMPGVTVIVRNQESGLFRETASGPDGSFFVSAMTPGVYQVEATLQGFKTYQVGNVQLQVGRTTTIEVPMEVGGIAESVTVSGEAPLVDTASKEIGGHISAREFIEAPSMNRNFTGVLATLPGVVATVSTSSFGGDTISAGGQAASNISYTMDGSNNNDGRSGGGNGSQARVAIEAVQEFKFLTGQFDAEYGMASGGIVNAVSKQGTNLFHGSAFAFLQDEKLNARDYFVRTQGLEEAQSQMQQFGGTLGGPIRTDRAHFFVSVERVILDLTRTTNVPSRPDLSQSDFEVSRNWNTFVRVDHQLNAGNTWGVRWLRDSTPQPLQLSADRTRAAATAEIDLDQTAIGTLSSVIGSTKVNTFRLGLTSEQTLLGNPAFNTNGRDQKSLPPTLTYASFSDQQSSRATVRDLHAYSVDNAFSWFLPNKAGDHELKVGFSYLYSMFDLQDAGNQNGTFVFSHDLPFNAADPRTYPERFSIRVPLKIDLLQKGHYVGVFAQDRWKMGDRLTVSLGARYDIEVIRTPNKENPLFADNPDGYPLDADNVQPRVGFSYALDGQGRSALRGAMGLFYQATSFSLNQPSYTDGRYSTSFTVQFPTNNIDSGSRNGQFPTDPTLANGPVVNHAAIDAQFPPGTLQRNVGTVRFDNPDRTVPYSRQYSLGYQTQLGSAFAVSVDYIRSESRNQYLRKDLNPARRSNGLATGTVTRTNPLVGAVGEFAARVETLVNLGWINYDSLQVAGTKRLSQGFSARVSYAYSKGRGNTPSGQGDVINSQYLNDLRLDTEEGPTSVDRPHILSVTGTWDVPRAGGLKISGVLQARSGTPFSLINTTFDADQNGVTTNEYLAAGTFSGTGPDAITVDYKGGRNGARGPSYVTMDLRAGYRFRLLGERTLDAHLDIFNIADRANFANPAGDQRLASFLRVTSITGAPRSAQLNLRLGF